MSSGRRPLRDFGFYLHHEARDSLPLVCYSPEIISVHDMRDGTCEMGFFVEFDDEEDGTEGERFLATLSTTQTADEIRAVAARGVHGIRIDSVDVERVQGQSGERYRLLRGMFLPLAEILGKPVFEL